MLTTTRCSGCAALFTQLSLKPAWETCCLQAMMLPFSPVVGLTLCSMSSHSSRHMLLRRCSDRPAVLQTSLSVPTTFSGWISCIKGLLRYAEDCGNNFALNSPTWTFGVDPTAWRVQASIFPGEEEMEDWSFGEQTRSAVETFQVQLNFLLTCVPGFGVTE